MGSSLWEGGHAIARLSEQFAEAKMPRQYVGEAAREPKKHKTYLMIS
jgi:hypothetical protein